jgi:hypothetical protein
MAYQITQQGDTVESYLIECVCDKLSDIATLPKLEKWPAGSACLVIENSSVWMLGLDGIWHEI